MTSCAGNIFINTNPDTIPFCTKLDVCIINGYVEANHDRVEFDEDITCAYGDIPLVGMFTRGLIIGKFLKYLVREGNE